MSGVEMGVVKKIWETVADRTREVLLAAIQGLDRGP